MVDPIQNILVGKKEKCLPLLVIAALFLTTTLPLFSQAPSSKLHGQSLPELRRTAPMAMAIFAENPIPYTFVKPDLFYPITSLKEASMPTTLVIQKVPAYWSYEDLGIFCKLEVQMEKAAKFPIKFRLGEVQEVERKEGKY